MNPYKELGVSTNADFPEVRKRFMELSRILHTDKGGSRTTAAMQLLSQAKTILLDPVARTIFDLDQSIEDCLKKSRREQVCKNWPDLADSNSWPHLEVLESTDSRF